ncbi:MAG: hypothetical protein HN732_26475, partial [Rhodospirillaceae bacterium]|nr:hypothetical protein [Rhodospirillaceae bacterium]
LDTPALDFVTIAKGMGIDGCAVSDPSEVAPAVKAAFEAAGPRLIAINIEGKR